MRALLPTVGEINLKQPSSWSARIALEQAEGVYIKDQRIAFVYAAAIGLTFNGRVDGKPLNIPGFKANSGDIIGYGVAVLDVLVGVYGLPPGPMLWRAGRDAADFISQSIPREDDVQEAADFTTPPAEK